MTPRSRLLTAVVVFCVLAAAVGFMLVMQKSPEAARLRLFVDVLLLGALAGTVVAFTRTPLERHEELLDAMRALARGARDKRLDYDRFGDLEDMARAYNELAAALTEHEDPNLGPIKSKRRQERPPWMEPDASNHPELGEIRVISKKQKAAEAKDAEERAAKARERAQAPEPVVERKAKAKKRQEAELAVPAHDDGSQRPAGAANKAETTPPTSDSDDDERSTDGAAAESSRENSGVASGNDVRAHDAAEPVEDARVTSAVADNDTAIDELLRSSKEADGEPQPDVSSEANEQRDNDDDAEAQRDPSREKTLPPFDMRGLFQEFVEAKRAHDEDTEDLEYDIFAETLSDEISRLMEAHACRAVRFEVRVQDGEVSLLPRLIR